MAKTALRAATYSRKSTQQRDIEDASTDRQIALAKSSLRPKAGRSSPTTWTRASQVGPAPS
jgi:hypothetical protein